MDMVVYLLTGNIMELYNNIIESFITLLTWSLLSVELEYSIRIPNEINNSRNQVEFVMLILSMGKKCLDGHKKKVLRLFLR